MYQKVHLLAQTNLSFWWKSNLLKLKKKIRSNPAEIDIWNFLLSNMQNHVEPSCILVHLTLQLGHQSYINQFENSCYMTCTFILDLKIYNLYLPIVCRQQCGGIGRGSRSPVTRTCRTGSFLTRYYPVSSVTLPTVLYSRVHPPKHLYGTRLR